MIGLERERNSKPAGFRTNILVSVGATLIMIVSIKMRLTFGDSGVDPARIAAQVVSGVGFLGAGTIIREGFSVRGLTTAAGLWAVAGVGLALGAGFYISATTATVLVILTLNLLNKIEGSIQRDSKQERILQIKAFDQSGAIGRISSVLENKEIIIKNINVKPASEETHVYFKLEIGKPRQITVNNLLGSLSEVKGVVEVKIDEG
jgi:putative Mg2+ transporter-C (MgtC) family protein